MSADDHLSPTQFYRAPNIYEGGERPEGLPYKGGVERVLPVDHVLHSTQGWLDKDSVRDFRDEDVREQADVEEGAPPRVSHYQGRDWIFDGHHRLVADRLEGRPTRVLYHS